MARSHKKSARKSKRTRKGSKKSHKKSNRKSKRTRKNSKKSNRKSKRTRKGSKKSHKKSKRSRKNSKKFRFSSEFIDICRTDDIKGIKRHLDSEEKKDLYKRNPEMFLGFVRRCRDRAKLYKNTKVKEYLDNYIIDKEVSDALGDYSEESM